MKTKKEIKTKLKSTFDYSSEGQRMFQGVWCHVRDAGYFIRIKKIEKPKPEIAIQYLAQATADIEKLKKHLEAWIAQAARIRAYTARQEATQRKEQHRFSQAWLKLNRPADQAEQHKTAF